MDRVKHTNILLKPFKSYNSKQHIQKSSKKFIRAFIPRRGGGYNAALDATKRDNATKSSIVQDPILLLV